MQNQTDESTTLIWNACNYQYTGRNIPEELNCPEHHCENFRIPTFLYFNLHFFRISSSYLCSFALYIWIFLSSLSFFFSLLLGAECDHFASDPFLLSVTFKLWHITTHTNFGVTHRTNFYLAFVVIRTCVRKQRLGKFVFILRNKRQRATLVQIHMRQNLATHVITYNVKHNALLEKTFGHLLIS